MEATAGQRDWENLKTFFTEDVFYKVGASTEMRGVQDVIDYVSWLFSNVAPRIPFYFRGIWEIEDTVIIEMDATFTRVSDGKPISFPCVDIMRFEGNKIREWRVYPDQTELWLSDKTQQQRLLKRVSTSTTKLPPLKYNLLNSQLTVPVSQLEIVTEIDKAIFNKDWEYFKRFFTDDVLFKVGASQDIKGYQGIADYLSWLYSLTLPQLPFTFRGTWELENVVIREMDVKVILNNDGKVISFPCADILRFEDNKIREWRSYPDHSELWLTEKVKKHGPKTYH
ncbi:nuclear transport factor 2 family protein [Aetokthonos hydrillicola Thurmond2011]|uniref:Nuclear transport factor 2 family protein n=2 Tax=Aetokthonos TaxID=1550243 RepID=A0AAP5I2I6_9CYAN|nr:nuclear transport factor 2 family protein [Aetokthonos hydrillicola]MDR9893515.1 nuclear transport factor 2 family protein [Aetokthonos hydrillicola Thurmond2011]